MLDEKNREILELKRALDRMTELFKTTMPVEEYPRTSFYLQWTIILIAYTAFGFIVYLSSI